MKVVEIETSLLNEIISKVRTNFPITNGICKISKTQKANPKLARGLIDMKISDTIKVNYRLNDSEMKFIIDEYLEQCLGTDYLKQYN